MSTAVRKALCEPSTITGSVAPLPLRSRTSLSVAASSGSADATRQVPSEASGFATNDEPSSRTTTASTLGARADWIHVRSSGSGSMT